MKSYVISEAAERDLVEIFTYTVTTWGYGQASQYLDLLSEAFVLLASMPHMGIGSARLSKGLRRFPVEKHVVFYRITSDGIRISRVLPQSRLPLRENFLNS